MSFPGTSLICVEQKHAESLPSQKDVIKRLQQNCVASIHWE